MRLRFIVLTASETTIEMKIIWLVCIIVISNQLDCGRANAYVQHDMLEYNIADSMRTAQKGTNFLNILASKKYITLKLANRHLHIEKTPLYHHLMNQLRAKLRQEKAKRKQDARNFLFRCC